MRSTVSGLVTTTSGRYIALGIFLRKMMPWEASKSLSLAVGPVYICGVDTTYQLSEGTAYCHLSLCAEFTRFGQKEKGRKSQNSPAMNI